MITVKVARLGTAVLEVALEDGSTVQNALDAASLVIGGSEEIRINESGSNLSDELDNGDIVTLVPKVKGGQKTVRVARLGSTVVEVAVADDANIQDALDAADVTLGNEDVRVDGRSVGTSDRINSADLITIVPKVKGGK